jgi:ribosomal protein S18 acetylase RimI-like enzyme
VDGFTYRWGIANVAVTEEFRRKGIGRELTRASIDFAHDHGAKEIFLQVNSVNQGAQVLYASLGFRPLVTHTTWQGTKSEYRNTPAQVGKVRERRLGEWAQQLALAERLHPEGLVWPYPLTPRLFRESVSDRFLGSTGQRHWVWTESGRMLGTVSARFRATQGQWRIMLAVDPEMRGSIEKHLVNAVLNELSAGKREMILDYPAGIAEKDLHDLGFRAKRTLTWMALRKSAQ